MQCARAEMASLRKTLPGKIFRIGKLPFNANLGAYYNVVRPDVIGPEYQVRFQIAVLLPTF